jgi:hypothetical protein
VDAEWFRPVGPLVLIHRNFLQLEGSTIAQAGRDPIGRLEDGAWSWDYGDQEEAEADWYRMRDYDPEDR